MTRSFRFQLAARFTLIMFLGMSAIAVLGYRTIRAHLDRQINSTLVNVASIQAASVTSSPGGVMAFHEWALTPEEAASVRELNRFAEVWNAEGKSLLRTQYITADLPLDTSALREALNGRIEWRQQSFQGLPVRSIYYPLGRLGEIHAPHVLQVAAPLAARNRVLRGTILFLLLVVVLASAGTIAGSWWLADRAITPVHAITRQATAIQPGSPHRLSASADTREYQHLIEVLNSMLDRLARGYDAQRKFTADASHELRSPLTTLRGELELARRRERSPAEYRAVIDSSLEEVERLSRLSEDLLTLARSDAGVMQPRLLHADLVETTERTLERLRGRADEKRLTLRLDAPEPMEGVFDPDLLHRAVWNLVENAIKFTPPGGTVAVDLARERNTALLRVRDTGPGISESHLSYLFERFYRADESRTTSTSSSGTGLGLAIVRAIVEVHGGRVSAGRAAEGGALFEIRLPGFDPSSSKAIGLGVGTA